MKTCHLKQLQILFIPGQKRKGENLLLMEITTHMDQTVDVAILIEQLEAKGIMI